MTSVPRWVDLVVLPIFNLLVALVATAGVIALVGQSPLEVMGALLDGALGTQRGLSYTLYYTTTFIFTGLAVAVAFHGGLFNIGGEGQALMGGLGAGLAAIWFSAHLPGVLMLPMMMLCGALFGALWAAVPAYLQAYRGSHIVISTIMFNFIAAGIFLFIMREWVKPASSMTVESTPFADSALMPNMSVLFASLGISWPHTTPFNATFFLALLAAAGVYVLLWHTKLGFRLRTAGSSPGAAHYAGMPTKRLIILSMVISGALAGLMAMNQVSGSAGRLQMGFVEGAGFTGIAVALMGRNHPLGIIMASVLFGALSQGGTEVAFVIPGFSKDMVVMMQGFIVLFSGAMTFVFAPIVHRLYRLWAARSSTKLLQAQV